MSLVLVVEDEAAIAELIAINLRHAGHEVILAEDAQAAQAQVDRRLPDLVLLDWMLPGVGGLQISRRWRADPRTRELPIIMLTARAGEADKISGLDAGADDYLTKPFSPAELLARIRRCCGGARRSRWRLRWRLRASSSTRPRGGCGVPSTAAPPRCAWARPSSACCTS